MFVLFCLKWWKAQNIYKEAYGNNQIMKITIKKSNACYSSVM